MLLLPYNTILRLFKTQFYCVTKSFVSSGEAAGAAEADAEVGQGGGVHRVEIPTDVNHKVLTKMRDGTPLLENSVHTMEQHVFAKGVSIIKFQPFLAYFC